MRGWTAIVVAVVASVAAASVTFAATSPRAPSAEIVVRQSRFDPERMTVKAGSTVRFVVRNADPIDHELIIGPDAVQRAHEQGTETVHGAKPGEVSVPSGKTRSTTYRFEKPGAVTFGCHLPGHFAYGMKATVTVEL